MSIDNPFGAVLSAANQVCSKHFTSKKDLFDAIYEKHFRNRIIQYLNPETNTTIKEYRIMGFDKDKGSRTILLLGDSDEKITLSETNTPYEKIYSYNVLADAGCTIAGGISRKRKTKRSRRKPRNNKKRKTYRKRR